MNFCCIDPADIDLSDTRFSLLHFSSSPHTEDNTTGDVQALGLLHPPLVLKQEENTLLLSGKEYVEFAVKNNKPTITVLALDQTKVTSTFIFEMLLQHKQLGKNLSSIEQAVFIKKALSQCSKDEVLAFLPMMGLKKKKHILNELTSLLDLSSTAQYALHSGTLSLRGAKKLLCFSKDDQNLLTRTITELQLGGSKQQMLIDAVSELCKRENNDAEKILELWQQQEIGKQYNGPQKASALLKWLKLRCSPRATAAEDEFQNFCRQLSLPKGVTIHHTTAFENDQITLTIDFATKKQLAALWPQLKECLGTSHLS